MNYFELEQVNRAGLPNNANVVASYAALGSAFNHINLQRATGIADCCHDESSASSPTGDPVFAAAEVGQGHDGAVAGICNYRGSGCASGGHSEVIDIARSHGIGGGINLQSTLASNYGHSHGSGSTDSILCGNGGSTSADSIDLELVAASIVCIIESNPCYAFIGRRSSDSRVVRRLRDELIDFADILRYSLGIKSNGSVRNSNALDVAGSCNIAFDLITVFINDGSGQSSFIGSTG